MCDLVTTSMTNQTIPLIDWIESNHLVKTLEESVGLDCASLFGLDGLRPKLQKVVQHYITKKVQSLV